MHEHRNTTLNIPRIMVMSLIAWGIATPLHELGHLLAAWSFGFTATLKTLSYNTGSVIIYGVMTPFELVVIASAGSAILILIGAILIVLKLQTVGVVFVLRSWTDMIPTGAKDGGIIADSSGMVVAVGLLLIEIMICSVILFYTRKSFFYPILNRSIDRLLSFFIVISVNFISYCIYYQLVYSLSSFCVNIYYYIFDGTSIYFFLYFYHFLNILCSVLHPFFIIIYNYTDIYRSHHHT